MGDREQLHDQAADLRPGLLPSLPRVEIFKDRAEMNFRDPERIGNILELLALLSSDAFVGEENPIGAPDHPILDSLVERLRSRGGRSDGISTLGERLGCAHCLISAQRSARLIR